MFATKHLTGRCVYETNKVVCIDVYLSKKYSQNKDIFLGQLLVSFVNQNISYSPVSFSNVFCTFSSNQYDREIKEGVKQYRKSRAFLGLLQ